VVYIPGAGSATDRDIDKRVTSFQYVFQRYNGHLADVKVFRADGRFEPELGPNFRWYTAQNEADAIQFFEGHQDRRNLHVVMSSAGAVFFRKRILPQLSNKQFGIVIEVEPMFPGTKPPTAPPDGYDPLVYVTMETQYTGDFAPTFKRIFGVAGSLIPGCSPPVCYQIEHRDVEINSPTDVFFRGIDEHSKGVTWGEDRASSIGSIGIRAGTSTLIDKLEDLVIDTPPQGPPSSPSTQPGGVPTISGGSGSGAAHGGDVGIESFPAWLDFKTYREQLGRAREKEGKP
jgi:hypothetical protein